MQDVLAILLAGGVGSRLNILVRKRAKPAVPFGGIYRIIDFTLSNIANSDLTCVAVLTQYKPLSLMDHIGDGSPWDLSGRTREVRILPPKTGEKDWDWYRGTADAVRQNLDFITQRPSREVIILSGDHVYHMDYRPLIAYHREKRAQVTVAMMPVPWEETHHFGIAITDETGRIIDWEEKPKKARSNLASMGVYVFDTSYLISVLKSSTIEDLDFGMHILPQALKEASVYAYRFEGYWRDVGTLESYFRANMDLLNPDSGLDPEAWGTMTNIMPHGLTYDFPPAQILCEGQVENSVISPGCLIGGRVENSVLSPGVVVEEEAYVKDCVLMHNVKVSRGARLFRVISDKEVFIGERARVGFGDAKVANERFPKHLFTGLTLIGKSAYIPGRSQIGTNCVIYPDVTVEDYPPDFMVKDGSTIQKRST
ncbi:glucose-1-phosphate adenylyltransferase family protein [Thermodesulfatator autotrophicus]|uniref:Glucose-1-phosphate adenylyltransferase n=1 Tax=Thermodesulfatator autotrophicus TaxID=1795632 RepID=A0A177E6V2_9BACT|nr:sugar phosphate nucleotidyltransferase [Thermodesulfatator autotrophicus]OAG27446.1 glucose-1-phosphate adenylyltransferase [Thermodesulfatator autotrophicus]